MKLKILFKNFTICLLHIFFAVSVSNINAQNIDIYALWFEITANPDDGFIQGNQHLVQLDPFTGQFSSIGIIPDVNAILVGSSTFDQRNSRYLFRGRTELSDSTYLYNASVNDASLTANPYLTENVIEWEYDLRRNMLYGLKFVQTGQLYDTLLVVDSVTMQVDTILTPTGLPQGNEYLVSLDLNTGENEEISFIDGVTGISLNSSTFNSNDGQYIFIGVDTTNSKRLYTIDVLSGEVVSNPRIEDYLYSELEYNNVTERLYVIQRDSQNNYDLSFGALDVTNGVFSELNSLDFLPSNSGAFPFNSGIVVGSTVIDQQTGYYIFKAYVSGQKIIYIIDSATGNLVNSAVATDNVKEFEVDNYTNFARTFYNKDDTLENEIDSLALFENYRWMNNYIDLENCSEGTTVTEYEYPGSNFKFLHITGSGGLGKLYSQDGTLYCTDSPQYSCIAAYSLTKVMDSWTCSNSSATSQSPDENKIFGTYSWLGNYVDPSDCFSGNKVSEFNFGSYSFVFVEGNNGGKLYFEDGTFYCSSSPNYDCLALYGFNNASNSWACEDGNENENETGNNQDDLFSTYPWLSTLIDTNDCLNTFLKVYAYGTYEFISIENREGINLYFQDGTFYCSDAPDYSCTNLYGLDSPKAAWQCEGGVINQKQASAVQQKIDFNSDFKVYPNPSNGKFMIEMEQNKSNTKMNIISTDGKLIRSIQVSSQQQFINVNIDDVPKGVYLLQLINLDDDAQQTQRIIIF